MDHQLDDAIYDAIEDFYNTRFPSRLCKRGSLCKKEFCTFKHCKGLSNDYHLQHSEINVWDIKEPPKQVINWSKYISFQSKTEDELYDMFKQIHISSVKSMDGSAKMLFYDYIKQKLPIREKVSLKSTAGPFVPAVAKPQTTSYLTATAPVPESTVAVPVPESTVVVPVPESTVAVPVPESTVAALLTVPVPESTVAVPVTVPVTDTRIAARLAANKLKQELLRLQLEELELTEQLF